MMNYLLTLKYDGSGFHGWQRQENAITVQECVEDAVKKLFNENIVVTGCSRTDTGVHANCFKCNFHSEKAFSLEKLISGMNYYLPESIFLFHTVKAGIEILRNSFTVKNGYAFR